MRSANCFTALTSILLLAGCSGQTAPAPSTPDSSTAPNAATVVASEGGGAASGALPSDAELDAFAKKERRQWRYDDGFTHTYNSFGTSGRFRHTDGSAWEHVLDVLPDVGNDLYEVARTDEYVELKSEGGFHIYRLYDDRFESKQSHLPEFDKLGPGRWVPLPDPREVAQIIAERKFWRYENAPDVFPNQASHAGVFRKQDARFWVEEGVGAGLSTHFDETARTDDYVEITKLDGGFCVRLYADRSEWRYGNETEFKPMFPGAWVGDGKLTGGK